MEKGAEASGNEAGSGRRLPAVPDPQTQLNLAERMINNDTSSARGTHSYGPFFLEYTMLAEYHQVIKQKLPGVYVLPSANDSSSWFCILFVRQGLYRDGIYRFVLTIPPGFPDAECPSVRFEPPVFHPLVNSETGQLDVQRQFPKWRRNVHHIWQVLNYVRRAFHKLEIHNACNTEAADLYTGDQAAFKRRVAAEIQLRKESVYDPPSSTDPFALRFTRWDQEDFESARKEMLNSQGEKEGTSMSESQVNGLSWMESNKLSIFCKTP